MIIINIYVFVYNVLLFYLVPDVKIYNEIKEILIKILPKSIKCKSVIPSSITPELPKTKPNNCFKNISPSESLYSKSSIVPKLHINVNSNSENNSLFKNDSSIESIKNQSKEIPIINTNLNSDIDLDEISDSQLPDLTPSPLKIKKEVKTNKIIDNYNISTDSDDDFSPPPDNTKERIETKFEFSPVETKKYFI